AVILGRVGDNFGAGMTGGMAYVYDEAGDFEARANMETLHAQPLASEHWEMELIALIRAHRRETGSKLAERLPREWETERRRFLQVCPKEMLHRIAHPLDDRAVAESA
ncbi:MAG: hypothetical protein AAF192_22530, partial [Pseudomonadota bacterium]